MKRSPFGTLGLVAALFGCNGPSGPKNTISPLPSRPRISMLRLAVENHIRYAVLLQPIVGNGMGADVGLGPPESLQKSKEKVVSKLVDLRMFDSSSDTTSRRKEGEVYLVHVLVSRDGKSYDGPEAYVAMPLRIAENAGAKGGRLTVEDKGVALTIGPTTLYGAWIPPTE